MAGPLTVIPLFFLGSNALGQKKVPKMKKKCERRNRVIWLEGGCQHEWKVAQRAQWG